MKKVRTHYLRIVMISHPWKRKVRCDAFNGRGIHFFFFPSFFGAGKSEVWLTKSQRPTGARHCMLALSRASCVQWCNVLHEPKL
jgi:hypothetical protein